MLRTSQDRRDVACLGLMVLVYGLVVGPVLHAASDHAGGLELPGAAQGWLDHQKPSAKELGHGHEEAAGGAESFGHTHAPDGPGHAPGHPAGHGRGKAHQHAVGSVEHLQAVAVSHGVVLAPVVGWVPLRTEVPPRPEWVAVAPLRPTAMPQGP